MRCQVLLNKHDDDDDDDSLLVYMRLIGSVELEQSNLRSIIKLYLTLLTFVNKTVSTCGEHFDVVLDLETEVLVWRGLDDKEVLVLFLKKHWGRGQGQGLTTD